MADSDGVIPWIVLTSSRSKTLVWCLIYLIVQNNFNVFKIGQKKFNMVKIFLNYQMDVIGIIPQPIPSSTSTSVFERTLITRGFVVFITNFALCYILCNFFDTGDKGKKYLTANIFESGPMPTPWKFLDRPPLLPCWKLS